MINTFPADTQRWNNVESTLFQRCVPTGFAESSLNGQGSNSSSDGENWSDSTDMQADLSVHCALIAKSIWSHAMLFSRINPFIHANKPDIFANSVDTDETARNEPSHQDLRCLPFNFHYFTCTHICISEGVQIRRWNIPFQKFRMKGLIHTLHGAA